jgi:hypothetical protein
MTGRAKKRGTKALIRNADCKPAGFFHNAIRPRASTLRRVAHFALAPTLLTAMPAVSKRLDRGSDMGVLLISFDATPPLEA